MRAAGGRFLPLALAPALLAGCDLAAPASRGTVDLPDLLVARPAPPGAPVPIGPTILIARSGAASGDSRPAIQTALDAAGPGGTVVLAPSPAAYVVTSAGPNPLNPGGQYALRVPAGVSLHISAGAVLELADGQQSDAAGPVDLVVFDGDDVSVTGGGTIRGNTAGQPDWTGGHQQITAGCLIRSWRPARRTHVSDLTLEDAFSNAAHIESHGPVEIARIRSSAVGEGVQIVYATDVVIEDIVHDDLANVSAGDGVEVSVVDRFSIRRVRVEAGSGGGDGSAVDVFGSSHGVLEDVEIVGWAYGIDVHDYVADPIHVSDDVLVRRVRIEGASVTGILSGADQRGSVRYVNVAVSGCGLGVQVLGPAGLPPLVLDSVRVDGCAGGVLIRGSRTVMLSRGRASGSHPLDGVRIEDQSGSDAPSVTLRAFSAVRSTRNGVRVEAPAAMLRIEGGSFESNRQGAFHGFPPTAVVSRAPAP